MSDHTHGPWEAKGKNGKYRDTDWGVVNDRLDYYAAVPVHRGGYVVAIIVDADGDDGLLDANASLISAAPELLEALEETLRPGGMYDRSVVHSQGAMQDEILALGRKIKSAIDKATGRSTPRVL